MQKKTTPMLSSNESTPQTQDALPKKRSEKSPQSTQPKNHKHTIYMDPKIWEQACRTAEMLNMSTSQLLTQLVVETADLIKPDSLLGIRRLIDR